MENATGREAPADSTIGNDDPAVCAHASCGCAPAPDHRPYCGAYCANADRDAPPEGACACEHEACAREQRVPEGADEEVTGLGPDPAA